MVIGIGHVNLHHKIDKSDVREAAIVLKKNGYVRDINQTRIDGKRLRNQLVLSTSIPI